MSGHIDLLNRRLAERLGCVCGGSLPRYAWKFAPHQPMYVYDRDNRTLLKRSWADSPGPDGKPIGAVWLLAEWRVNRNVDAGTSAGVRVPVIGGAGYSPYLETAMPPGREPSEAENQHLISDIDRQLAASAEHDPNSFENYMADEKSTADANKRKDKAAWRETTAEQYDNNVGAFGNCAPGTRGGYMSFGGI